MSKGDSFTPPRLVHSCTSGRVACETAAVAEERLGWKRQEVGLVERTKMEKCFPGFEHGRFFQALSARLVLGLGRSKAKVRTNKNSKKKAQQSSGSAISFHSVPEENVNHNMDPVSPMVSCIGQVRAGGQRKSSSSSSSKRKRHLRRIVSEDKFQGRWNMWMPCSNRNDSSSEDLKEFYPVFSSGKSSVSSSNQSSKAGGGCMLARSLLLLQEQMDHQALESSTSSSSSSSSPSPRNQSEICLWKRRCVPQPQCLQLQRGSRSSSSST